MQAGKEKSELSRRAWPLEKNRYLEAKRESTAWKRRLGVGLGGGKWVEKSTEDPGWAFK